MTKGFQKKTSKRMSCKRRYNIEKKVRQHNKKLKKELKKKNHHSNKRKDPGVPNSLPFKEAVIREAQQDKQRDEERRQLVRNQRKDGQQQKREEQLMKKRGLTDLISDAELRGKQFESKTNEIIKDNIEANYEKSSNLKTYYKEFHKVIEASDVIIEVLDARDPIGSRCPQVEEQVIKNGANKRLILLLNKVDLIPRANLQKWLQYLRNELPTVAFKACTQKQNSNLSRSNVNVLVSSDELLSSSKCLGADILMKLLSNYCRNKDIKITITVGIVGFPNVGKSSVINSLKRCHSCNVGPTPGVTKSMQLVSLDKHIKLLDSPGIIFANNSQTNEISSLMALRNAINVDSMSDPISPIETLLKRVNHQELILFYRLPAFQDVNQFLTLLAKRFGKLKKGGLLDIEGAARKVLNDWNIGKIKYYTIPPETNSLSFHISAQIVSQMSQEFNINEHIFDEEMNEINKIIPQNVNQTQALVVESFGFTSSQIESNDNEDNVDVMDQTESVDQSVSSLRQTKIVIPKEKKSEDVQMQDMDLMKGMQLNKQKKVMFKKIKKNRKRKQKAEKKLSKNLESNLSLDFETNL
ncbi:guanine nucleotide-binding protein-like 3 homolog [Oppia nitens]|uniref:guanine nucleotide-binding protein-like 3 homolog n=1 Tax=Oppia nitens TaxID=1686743 RepID=UPI0023DCA6F5|nr:guanine nucleotide-binding protein-like 3 homolog [Oppia nitens]